MTSHYKKKKRKAVLLIPAAALAVLVLLLVFRPRAAHLNEEEAQGVEQAAEKSGDGIRETVQEFEPHLEEYERLDAFYEEWLAAAVITGISMNEPDFVLEEVYTASETAPDHPWKVRGFMLCTRPERRNVVFMRFLWKRAVPISLAPGISIQR